MGSHGPPPSDTSWSSACRQHATHLACPCSRQVALALRPHPPPLTSGMAPRSVTRTRRDRARSSSSLACPSRSWPEDGSPMTESGASALAGPRCRSASSLRGDPSAPRLSACRRGGPCPAPLAPGPQCLIEVAQGLRSERGRGRDGKGRPGDFPGHAPSMGPPAHQRARGSHGRIQSCDPSRIAVGLPLAPEREWTRPS